MRELDPGGAQPGKVQLASASAQVVQSDDFPIRMSVREADGGTRADEPGAACDEHAHPRQCAERALAANSHSGPASYRARPSGSAVRPEMSSAPTQSTRVAQAPPSAEAPPKPPTGRVSLRDGSWREWIISDRKSVV